MQSIVIGPYVVDAAGGVRTLTQLLAVRIGGMAEHLTEPRTRVYMLGMDGPPWDCDLLALNCTEIFDLVKELEIPANQGEQPHFKAAHTMNGTLWVASNTFEEADAVGAKNGGRLATWTGGDAPWTILERTAFTEVTGRHNFGRAVLRARLGRRERDPEGRRQWWRRGVVQQRRADVPPPEGIARLRSPLDDRVAAHPRGRDRALPDGHARHFYELPPLVWGGAVWGIRPIAQHLRMVPDFASYRGYLVLGGNQVSSIFDANWVTGQSQAGLWFGKTDDLFSFGKPQGWGGPWLNDVVLTNETSDPY